MAIPDLSKLNLKGIMDNVKAMIGQTPIPEVSKDDPIGYRLSELSKITKSLADLHAKEADEISKLSNMLGALYQDLTQVKAPTSTAPKTVETVAEKPAAETEETAAIKVEEKESAKKKK